MANITVNFRVDLSLRDSFQKYYPYCLSKFLVCCIKLALKDKKFFESVYFSDLANV